MPEKYVKLTEREKQQLTSALNAEFQENRITLGGYAAYLARERMEEIEA